MNQKLQYERWVALKIQKFLSEKFEKNQNKFSRFLSDPMPSNNISSFFLWYFIPISLLAPCVR